MSRYTDIDKLLEQYKPRVSDDVWKESEFYKIINDAPTADVVEVKHEYWKGFTRSRFYGIDEWGEPIYRDGVMYRCSNPKCNKGTVIKAPYCQWCGARMDAKEP